MNALELDKQTRVVLTELRGHPELSISALRQLTDLGFSPKVAWSLVEATLSSEWQ